MESAKHGAFYYLLLGLGIVVAIMLTTVAIMASNVTVTATTQNVAPVVRTISITSDPLAPGAVQVVNVMVMDANGYVSFNATNLTCWGGNTSAGAEGGTDGWDHWTNTTPNQTYHNVTAMNYTFTYTASDNAANGTWQCKIYANDSGGLKATNTAAFQMSTRVGITISSPTGSVSGNPGDANTSITSCSPNTITHDGNQNMTLAISGTDLTGQTDASWVVKVGNITTGNATVLWSTALTTGAVSFDTKFWRGNSPTANTTSRYMWFSFPIPLKVQDYVGTVTIAAS